MCDSLFFSCSNFSNTKSKNLFLLAWFHQKPIISSKYTQTPVTPSNNASIKRWKIPSAALIPEGNLLKSKSPLVVIMVK